MTHLLGVDLRLDANNLCKVPYNTLLKNAEFYDWDENKKRLWLSSFDATHKIIGAHRQQGYEFGYQTVSIDPRDSIDILASRYYNLLENKLINDNRMQGFINNNSLHKEKILTVLHKQIYRWAEINILRNDNIVSLKEVCKICL